MLFLHEVHQVVGTREDEFESTIRDVWLPALAKGSDARLLYFLHHAHGTGPSYRVITLTAVRDGAAWQRLGDRVDRGDLAGLSAHLDGLRHDVSAKLLRPLPWSPLAELDLDAVPGASDHPPAVFMEDTVWPYEGLLEDYVERSGAHYAVEMAEQRQDDRALLEVQAAFRTAWGSGRRREIVLWQKVLHTEWLGGLVSREVPGKRKAPGTWMHDALALRDRWESRLLRSSTWSPWS